MVPPICPRWIPNFIAIASSQRFAEPAIALERVAELLVPRGVMRAREQKRVTPVRRALAPVLAEAQADLLVVGIVAFLHGGQRERPHERLAIVAGVQIRLHPRAALLGGERHLRGLQPLEERALAEPRGTLGRARRLDAVARCVAYPVRGLIDEGSDDVEQLEPVRVIERV